MHTLKMISCMFWLCCGLYIISLPREELSFVLLLGWFFSIFLIIFIFDKLGEYKPSKARFLGIPMYASVAIVIYMIYSNGLSGLNFLECFIVLAIGALLGNKSSKE